MLMLPNRRLFFSTMNQRESNPQSDTQEYFRQKLFDSEAELIITKRRLLDSEAVLIVTKEKLIVTEQKLSKTEELANAERTEAKLKLKKATATIHNYLQKHKLAEANQQDTESKLYTSGKEIVSIKEKLLTTESKLLDSEDKLTALRKAEIELSAKLMLEKTTAATQRNKQTQAAKLNKTTAATQTEVQLLVRELKATAAVQTDEQLLVKTADSQSSKQHKRRKTQRKPKLLKTELLATTPLTTGKREAVTKEKLPGSTTTLLGGNTTNTPTKHAKKEAATLSKLSSAVIAQTWKKEKENVIAIHGMGVFLTRPDILKKELDWEARQRCKCGKNKIHSCRDHTQKLKRCVCNIPVYQIRRVSNRGQLDTIMIHIKLQDVHTDFTRRVTDLVVSCKDQGTKLTTWSNNI